MYPAVEIARLAIDKSCRKKSLGSILLAYIIDKILELSKLVGIKYVFLFALPSAKSFYTQYNKADLKFLEFPKDIEVLTDSQEKGCVPLYLPLFDTED